MEGLKRIIIATPFAPILSERTSAKGFAIPPNEAVGGDRVVSSQLQHDLVILKLSDGSSRSVGRQKVALTIYSILASHQGDRMNPFYKRKLLSNQCDPSCRPDSSSSRPDGQLFHLRRPFPLTFSHSSLVLLIGQFSFSTFVRSDDVTGMPTKRISYTSMFVLCVNDPTRSLA